MKDQGIRESDGFDALGRARFKTCPDCGAQVGRTLSRCLCGREFIGRNKARELRRAAGETVARRPRKTKVVTAKPEPEAQLLALAEPPMKVPQAARFVVSALVGGGLQLHWPDFDVKFTPSPTERLILRSVA